MCVPLPLHVDIMLTTLLCVPLSLHVHTCIVLTTLLDQFIHSTVVDTALVFPHPRGLPYKRALKSLIAEHLKRFIQDNIGWL